jgi:MFS family permease
MNETSSLADRRNGLAWRLPVYYGWVNVLMAAAAMTATLPGRTHGLGLITEPLIAELGISRPLFADINLVGTLLGAAFCLPAGWCIDRYGVRVVGTGVLAALAAAVWAMSGVQGATALFASLVVVRGFGQSGLTVASIAMIGKWFPARSGPAMGVFAVLLTFGFIGTILGVGEAVAAWGWREAWRSIAIALVCFAPIAWLLVRDPRDDGGTRGGGKLIASANVSRSAAADGMSLLAALRTPAFWVFALGTAGFNFVWTAITLFNEAILAERGFAPSAAVAVMAVLTGCGLIANLVGGALASRRRLGRLLAFGLAILAGGLGAYPSIAAAWQLHVYAVSIGLSGGIVTVIFFTAWGQLFGAAHVGKILGAAQLMTVCSSALGPVWIARAEEASGSFAAAFYVMSGVTALAAVAALVVKLPGTDQVASHGS